MPFASLFRTDRAGVDRVFQLEVSLGFHSRSDTSHLPISRGFNYVNGLSTVGGQTYSAYIIGGIREGEAPMGHTSPCGTSTGSAVGVSAGYNPLAIGTETDGSLAQQAGRAALFALKPTAGSVLREGA
ncbi:hypothetical protein B0O99DRAFT_680959 [Bisporella sp. PMI_857]|nr:hypothetical protein B0O99DRAFT_680959 [Bisporella sp. PMI_857]